MDLYQLLVTIGMKYKVLYASMVSILVAVGLTNILNQPANASTGPFIDICKVKPWVCEGVTLPWWWWILGCPGCPPEWFDLGDIITLPENQSLSVSVHHGPISDTIMIEIPKALSSSILNQTVTEPEPQPWMGPGQNQTVQSN